MYDWTSQGDNQSDGAFLQWKPVCYVKTEYNTRSVSRAGHYGLKNFTDLYDLDRQPQLLYAYFGDTLEKEQLAVKAVNVSFGFTGDKFYRNTDYTGW